MVAGGRSGTGTCTACCGCGGVASSYSFRGIATIALVLCCWSVHGVRAKVASHLVV